MNETTAAVAKAATAGTALPPYSGPESLCAKCSNVGAYTEHRDTIAPGVLLQSDSGRLRRGPLPERLQRRCERCDFTWDEALCPPGCGMTVEALAHAVDNATPYPIDLDLAVCRYMARYLLECLHITARQEHPLWQYDDGRPDDGPAPQPETPPADSEATE